MTSKFQFYNHSSSPAPRRKYDVFLSFRGEDTREVFAYNLYKAFVAKGLHTFRDDDEIEAGKEVNAELTKAIEESTYSVLVISINYANSSWCLNELVKILECKTTRGQAVYPVFYHVDPSDVRKQTGKFGEGFSEAVSKKPKNSQIWKEALEEIAGLKGWVYPSPQYGAEADLYDVLAEKIFINLKDTDPYHLEGLVGMTSRMERVINLLDLESDEARIVGLWGMGGLGKTTIARAVYDSIFWKFKGYSFIENVNAVASRSGLTAIQEQIISDTLKVDIKVASVKTGTDIFRKRVCCKNVLIVFDDVDESIELESLIGDPHWLSPGSRIIITTRDRQCLTRLSARVYKVQGLNDDEAEELFKYKAFGKNGKTRKFGRLIARALHYADGLPLAVKILGSFLSNLTRDQWVAALKRLERSPGDKVQQVLRISYDGLNREDKDIFLDISCFFRGKYKDEVINLLDSCGFNPDIGVENLVKKSLLTILENNTVWMHHLVQKMGWTIVQEESTKEPGERSRLWHHDDIKQVLSENTGTENIEGICDHFPAIGARDLKLSPQAFAKMKKLRVLQICYTCPSIDLPNTLRYLNWNCYPLKCMPSRFQPKHLVELRLTNSCIEQLWKGVMVLPRLTVLDLRYSVFLTKSPDFTGFPNLEKLYLEGCIALRDLHPSLQKLKKLTILVLKDCSSLKDIPDKFESQCLEILVFSDCLKLSKILERFGELKLLSELYLDGTGITELPQSISKSTGLCYLDLSRCKNLKRIPSDIGLLKKLKMLLLKSCSSLDELPEEVGNIENLEILDVAFSGVRKLPASVVRLRNLQVLALRECNGYPFPSWMYMFISIFLPEWTSNCMTLVLPSLSVFKSLTSLDLGFCGLKSVPGSISCCFSLRELILTGNKFESLPASIKDLSNLEYLWLRKCEKLKEIPELPSTVRYLMASGCNSLKTICSPSLLEDARLLCFSNCSQLVDNKEINTLMECKFLINQIKVNNHAVFRVYSGPGSKIPKWFTDQNVGASINFHLPLNNEYSSKLLGIALSAVVSTKGKDSKIGVQIKVGNTILKDCWAFLFYKNLQDLFILYFPIQVFMVDGLYPAGTEIEICFSTTEYDGTVWTFLVDKVGNPALEVNSCGARLIYDTEVKSCGIIEIYNEAPSVKPAKFKIFFSFFWKLFKIFFSLFILLIFLLFLYN